MFKNMFNYLITVSLQYFILSDEYTNLFANPLYGQNVRLARINEFPFIVSIGRINDIVHRNNHFCTGSLITPKHVLTSAHCVSGQSPFNLRVKVGTINLAEGKNYHVLSIVTYQDWATMHNAVSFKHNDLAILELRKRVNETGVKPAPYVKKSKSKSCGYIGKTVVTAGWGSADCSKYTTKLHTATLKVIDQKTCAENLSFMPNEVMANFDRVLCTNANPHAVLGCGDSGGPLLLNGVIIGVNEAALPEQVHEADHSIEQNFHTPLSYYVDFIRDALKGSI